MQTYLTIQMSEVELRELIADVVRQELAQIQRPDPNNDIEVWTMEAVAKFFGVSKNTLHKWSQKGMLPRVNLGHRVFYRRSDILKMLQEGSEKYKKLTRFIDRKRNR